MVSKIIKLPFLKRLIPSLVIKLSEFVNQVNYFSLLIFNTPINAS